MAATPSQTTTESIAFPRQPNPGSIGRRIDVRVNAFEIPFQIEDEEGKLINPRLHKLRKSGLDQYRVSIQLPKESTFLEVKDKKARRIIFSAVDWKEIHPIAFDGKFQAWCPSGLLPFEGVVEFPSMPNFDDGAPPRKFLVKLIRESSFGIVPLGRFLFNPNDPLTFQSKEVLQVLRALNSFLHHSTFRRYHVEGDTFFDSQDRGGHPNMNLLRGYIQHIRPARRRLILNMDVRVGVFLPSNHNSLLEAIVKLLSDGPLETHRSFHPRDFYADDMDDTTRLLLRRLLKNQEIEYIPIGSKVVQHGKISDISKDAAHRELFVYNDKEISVADFISHKYNIRLQHPQVPCIKIKNNQVSLPMELCRLKKNQFFRGKLSPSLIRSVLQFVKMDPATRLSKVLRMKQQLEREGVNVGHPDLRNIGLNVGPKLMEITARVLAPPRLSYDLSKVIGTGPSVHDPNVAIKGTVVKDGKWNVIQEKFCKAAKCHNWLILALGPEDKSRNNNFRSTVDRFRSMLRSTTRDRGMDVSQPAYEEWYQMSNPERQRRNIGLELENRIRKHMSAQHKLNLVLVILEYKDSVYRAFLKRFLDGVGIPSQFALFDPKNLRKINDQYVNNLLLKINVKLGGYNHFVQPVDARIPSRYTMAMGADSSHALVAEKPSIVAVVASMNDLLTQYSAEVRAQPLIEVSPQQGQGSRFAKKSEVIDDLSDMAKILLNRYKGNMGRYPQHLVFFRDGVSESEYVAVMKHEVHVLLDIITQCHGELPSEQRLQIQRTQLTYIICGKRHNFRFEPIKPDHTCVKGNCPPGTVIDDHIITPQLYDYYIQTHAAIQGTSASTHYVVLYDDHQWHPDRLHPFCNALANNYQKATRSISMPAPVYYADMVCTRAREWFFEEDDEIGTHKTPDTETREADFFAYKHRLELIQPGLVDMANKNLMWFS